ncbi:MAG: response regulator transcription factor [Pigmentiphaga sp.]|uniref:helix-turn-helix transcriptional regulator n=1 Tax=Pigmentiphaga sp. TaxID=1977564 RepID=UPI00299FA467|nr:response regulator transcription factor [Pigmentiphaga sp.]MDX3905553.1 response regulator transcription factor [Pigmentiphaga sp.]
MATVLIEDYALLRLALEHVLMRVQGVGEIIVLSARQLSDLAGSWNRQVELLVMDVHPDAVQAVDTLERALALFSPRAVLTLYGAEDAAVSAAFARRGVQGYIPRSSSPAALAAAVSLVLAGGECYPRREALVPELSMPAKNPVRGLTKRQEEILRLLVQGHSMREIAERIGISSATVKSHARTLYWKLNVRNQAEAAFVARRRGLIKSGDEDAD